MKAILFDMDGVLVDTPKYACRVVNKLLAKYSISFSEEEFKEYIGVSTKGRVLLWNKKFNLKIDTEQFSKDFIKTQLETMQDELKSNVEVSHLLQSLRDKGYRIGLTTSSRRIKTEQILEMLDVKTYFDIVLTADEIVAHKPDPSIYLEAAKQLQSQPKECVIIEDSPSGIKAGKSAGMKVIALQTTMFGREELLDADVIIDKLSEIEANI